VGWINPNFSVRILGIFSWGFHPENGGIFWMEIWQTMETIKIKIFMGFFNHPQMVVRYGG
jgi:hypothetical protein